MTRFPGRTLKTGEPDTKVVRAAQRRLNAVGCGPIAADGEWGTATPTSRHEEVDHGS